MTSRGGNLYGIVGMVIAIGVTVASPGVVAPWLIIGGLVIGGAIGAVVAMRIQMTALPQLVAAFHSLVGLGRGVRRRRRPSSRPRPSASARPARSRCTA